jgi:hypothetical protein
VVPDQGKRADGSTPEAAVRAFLACMNRHGDAPPDPPGGGEVECKGDVTQVFACPELPTDIPVMVDRQGPPYTGQTGGFKWNFTTDGVHVTIPSVATPVVSTTAIGIMTS